MYMTHMRVTPESSFSQIPIKYTQSRIEKLKKIFIYIYDISLKIMHTSKNINVTVLRTRLT